jgi:hypothetical protein
MPKGWSVRGTAFVHHILMVKRAQICAFSQAVAREFHPQKIVLFGSYACGHPGEGSDVRGYARYRLLVRGLRPPGGYPQALW